MVSSTLWRYAPLTSSAVLIVRKVLIIKGLWWLNEFLAVFAEMARALINTPLQRGGGRLAGHFNRFSGFPAVGAWRRARRNR